MEQTRQKRTAKGFLAAVLTFVVTIATVFAILPQATLTARAEGTTVNLSTLTEAYTAQDGEILTGTLGGNYKISIADGATVTLKNAIINGENDISYSWAGITCLGDATIILEGENTVKGFYEDYSGIYVPDGKTLTIEGEGTLSASSNGYAAGIGANGNSGCGNIVINDGVINATGGSGAAGIGGSVCSPCGDITINGGAVTATGSVGIGAGNKDSCGDITISGGNVTAIGGNNGTGIGSGFQGSCGAIAISGGTVTATGGDDGAGIGSGATGTCDNITIANTVTKVTATKGENATNSIGIGNGGSCGTVTIGGVEGAITESPYTYTPFVDLSTLTADYVAQDGEILTGTLGGTHRLSIAGGATVTLKDVTINSVMHAGLTCNNATLILKGKNTVRSSAEYCPGILVADYSQLTISGDGSLDVYGAENAAGIGGRFNTDCGTIVIESGTITAHGGTSGAGIGSGNYSACSGIEISGGIVKAYGGEDGGAGIGTGAYASYCAYIKISGGRIYAQGTAYEYDWGSAGIGTGVSSAISSGDSTCANITITGGNIEAVGGPGAAAIGAGSGYKFYDVEMEEEYVSTSECDEILITDGVGKLKATKGSGSPQTIGGGKISRCVWGVKVLGSGAVTESPYNYLSPGPAGVIVLIDEIPNPVSGSNACKKAIEAARAAYNNLATDEQKALVTNYDVLTDAEAVFAVTVANEKIDAIPAVENITLESKTVIEAARAAYNALADAQKGEIDAEKVNKLTAAEAKYAEVKEADDTAKANNAMDKINAIGEVEYTPECKAKIDAARTAYDALTDDQQAKVTNYNTLMEAESSYQVAETEALIAAIGTVEYTPECKAKIDEAKAAYDALTPEQKALVNNANTLTTAETTYATLKADNEAAVAVVAKINAIGMVEYTAENKAKIDEANAAYEALTPEQKELVTNYSVLTTAEQTYAEKEAEATAKKGLPGGVIALIVILSVLAIGCGAFAIVWFVVKKKTWADFVELVKACCGKVAAFFRNLFKKK